jgi:hypothetical protein
MSTNEFCLGTIENNRPVAVHINGFPVKYWPDGPGTYSGDPGWYYWDEDDEDSDDGFVPFELDNPAWEYPICQVWDTEYRSLVLLAIVPAVELDLNLRMQFVAIKPYTAEQVKAFLAGWEH